MPEVARKAEPNTDRMADRPEVRPWASERIIVVARRIMGLPNRANRMMGVMMLLLPLRLVFL